MPRHTFSLALEMRPIESESTTVARLTNTWSTQAIMANNRLGFPFTFSQT